jgi:hypothetical protein
MLEHIFDSYSWKCIRAKWVYHREHMTWHTNTYKCAVIASAPKPQNSFFLNPQKQVENCLKYLQRAKINIEWSCMKLEIDMKHNFHSWHFHHTLKSTPLNRLILTVANNTRPFVGGRLRMTSYTSIRFHHEFFVCRSNIDDRCMDDPKSL